MQSCILQSPMSSVQTTIVSETRIPAIYGQDYVKLMENTKFRFKGIIVATIVITRHKIFPLYQGGGEKMFDAGVPFLCMMESGEEAASESQEDELIALSSIYDDKIFTRLENGGEVRISLKVPDDFKVTNIANIASKRTEMNADETSQNNDVICNVFPVKYLPPLVLNFVYPPGYPLSDPPQYTLKCKWLNVKQVNNPYQTNI